MNGRQSTWKEVLLYVLLAIGANLVGLLLEFLLGTVR